MITIIIWTIIGLTGLFALVNIYYYLFVFSKFAFDKTNENTNSTKTPVSVIITAKNELKNLQQFLPFVLSQNYPEFEVVVVNDGSWDETTSYIEELMKTESRLKLVDLKLEEKYLRGKKFALTLGIKATQYEWLLLTDSNCKPITENWISEMSTGMRDDKEIVIGYTRPKRSNSLINIFMRWETFYNALQFFSYALSGNPYTADGRNLAYRKSLFFKVKGFASHQHILTGTDELFVNETANNSNVAVVYSRDSFTEALPKQNNSSWWNLKKRHFYTGKFYKKPHKRMIGFFNVSHILFYIFLTLAFVLGSEYWPYILGIFLLRLIIQAIIFFNSMKKLRIAKIFGLFWLFDWFMVAYYLTVGFSGIVTKKIKS